MEGKKNYYKKTYKATEKIPAYKPKRGAQSKLMTEDEKQKAEFTNYLMILDVGLLGCSNGLQRMRNIRSS